MASRRNRTLSLPSHRRSVVIAPSLLSADFADLKSELKRVERAGCDWIHLDIMDGHFVPNLTIGPPVVAALRRVSKRLFFDAHLMVAEPWKLIPDFARAGVQLVTIHAEACPDPKRLIRQLKRLKLKTGVSIKPRTALSAIDDVLAEVDLVLVMTVEPGFGGQELIPSALNKVRRLKLMREGKGLGYLIQVDGGVNPETAPLVVAAGADVLVAGSAIFGPGGVRANIKRLRASIESALA